MRYTRHSKINVFNILKDNIIDKDANEIKILNDFGNVWLLRLSCKRILSDFSKIVAESHRIESCCCGLLQVDSVVSKLHLYLVQLVMGNTVFNQMGKHYTRPICRYVKSSGALSLPKEL